MNVNVEWAYTSNQSAEVVILDDCDVRLGIFSIFGYSGEEMVEQVRSRAGFMASQRSGDLGIIRQAA